MSHKFFNRASGDYRIQEKFTAGLALTGAEAKSLRVQGASFTDSRLAFDNSGTLLLLNFHIPPYKFAASQAHNPTRSRPLLLSQKELSRLASLKKQGYMLIPLSIFLKKRWWKVKIAAGKRLRKYEKRRQIVERSIKRELDRQVKKKRI